MNVEHRLRVRVDKLSDELDEAGRANKQLRGRVKALEEKYTLRGHCSYCGVPIGSLRRTCVDHSDLLRIDPLMQR